MPGEARGDHQEAERQREKREDGRPGTRRERARCAHGRGPQHRAARRRKQRRAGPRRAQPDEDPDAPDRAEAGVEHLADDRRCRAPTRKTPAAVAPCSTMPECRSRPPRRPRASRHAGAGREALRGRAPLGASACDRGSAGSQIASRKNSADREGDRGVLRPARDAERDLGHLTDVALLGEQLRDGRAGRGRLAVGEHEAARTRGGCPPRSPGRWRCSCPSETRLQLHREIRPRPRGGRPRRSRRAALAVEDPDRAEAALDRLAEAELDLARQALERRARQRLRALEHRMAPALRGHASATTVRRAGAARCLTRPSSTGFASVGGGAAPGAGVASWCSATPPISSRATAIPTNSSGDVPEEDAGIHSSVPRAFAGCPPIHRHAPVEILVRCVLVLHLRRVPLLHQVDAMVEPPVAPVPGHRLPLRLRSSRLGGYGRSA